MLTATAKNANGSLFPLVYTVVDVENNNNWLWFSQYLKSVIVQHASEFLIPQSFTFITDHQKGLLESIKHVFPGSPHSYYIHHLYKNMYKSFKHPPSLKTLLFAAAEATTEDDFTKALDEIKGISENVLN